MSKNPKNPGKPEFTSGKPSKPGRDSPSSGQYEVVGPGGKATGKEVTVIRGEPLPPTIKPGQGYLVGDPLRKKSGEVVVSSGDTGPGQLVGSQPVDKPKAVPTASKIRSLPPAVNPQVAKEPLQAPRPHTGYTAERAAYALLKPDLLATAPGRFVVLVGDDLVGPCDTFRDAYLAGRRRFGPGPLYVKQVLAEEPAFEPIALEPCPS